MQRVYWTVDFLEAHLIAGFLRAEGVDAEIFDVDFIRQDWLGALAYGGYRVVVADEDAAAARQLIAHRQANDFALDEADPNAPVCPRCSSRDTAEDPVPRRIGFWFLLSLAFPIRSIVASVVLFFLMLALASFNGRFRCATCGKRWKAMPTHAFRELAHRADAADAIR